MIVATTTFFQSQTNYGQLLQAYALQQVLMKMGHYPYIIRYGFHEKLRPVHGIEFPQINKEKLQSNLHIKSIAGNKDDRHFDDFRRQHINMSENAYNTLEELQCHPPIADCYLSGSDQVWAQLLDKQDNGTFFLDFGYSDTERIAYAPSFSLDAYPEHLHSLLKSNLERFDAISVREKSGVDICKKVGIEAKWVLDPTMLLNGDYYKQLAQESESPLPSNYMFVYHVNIKREDLPCWKSAIAYNNEHELKAIAVHANGEGQSDIEFLNEAEYYYPSIQDWIRLINNSQYVLTSSFHGMVFAILLHKPFIICLRPESMFAGNDRIFTILSTLGLEKQLATNDTDLSSLLAQPINWDDVDARIDQLREESLAFLETSLSQDERLLKYQNKEEWILRCSLKQTEMLAVQNTELKQEAELSTYLLSQIESLRKEKEAAQREASYFSDKNQKHLRIIRIIGVIFSLSVIAFIISTIVF